MSWTDEKKNENLNQTKNDTKNSKDDSKLLTDSQKIELIAQTVDQLATENDLLNFDMRENLQSSQDLNKLISQKLSQLDQKCQTLDQNSKQYEQQVLNLVKWKTLAKHGLELLFYVVVIGLLYKSLTTSLWQVLGFKALYEQVQQFKYGGLIVTAVYILLNILALVWLVKKLVKTWRY